MSKGDRGFRAAIKMYARLRSQTELCGKTNGIFVSFLLLALIITGPGIAYAQGDHYTVKGRVVDQNGNPFSDGGICIEPAKYESRAFDRFVECVGSDSDGRFEIRKVRKASTFGKRHFLFVAADNTLALSPLTPPFDLVRRFDKSFNGKLVNLGKRSLLNLGDVKVQFWYGSVTLEFSSIFSNPEKRVDWRNAWLRIFNKNGNVVYFSTLSKEDIRKYVKNNGSTLSIALPEGKWKAEVLVSYGKLSVGYSSYFYIRRNSEQIIPMKAGK